MRWPGRRMSFSTRRIYWIGTLEEDLLNRFKNARRAPAELRRQVERKVREARAEARAEVTLEPADAFRQSKVDAIIEERIRVRKASHRFPRQSLRDGGRARSWRWRRCSGTTCSRLWPAAAATMLDWLAALD